MCRWLMYQGDPLRMDRLLLKPENSLIHQSISSSEGATDVNGDGFGICWYASDIKTPGLYKDVLPAWNDENLKSIVRHIKPALFSAHIRATTGTPSSRENCHPFTWKNWSFMHNGSIPQFDRIRYEVDSLIDPKFYAHKKGCTDTESMFFIALSMGMAYQPKKALEKMLASILSIMHKNNIQGALRATIAACDGFSTYTMRYGSETDHCPTLYYTDKDGVYNITSDSRVKHNPNPATLVISEPLDHSPSVYEPIKNGEFLTLASNGRIEHDDLCF